MPDAVHPALEHALVAEPVDQRNRGQQRRRQQRDQRDAAKQGFERHARARQRIGEAERQRHGDRGDHGRHPQAVPQAGQQRRRLGIFDEVGQRHELALPALQRLQQDGEQRQRQECHQDQRNDEQARMRDAIGPVRRLPDRRAGDDCGQHGSHQNTLMRSGSSLSFSGEPTASDCSDRKFSDRYTVSLCASSAGDATRTWQ